MQRFLGATMVFVGSAILAVDLPRGEGVVASLSRGRGLHLSDIIGVVGVVAGVALLWAAPRR